MISTVFPTWTVSSFDRSVSVWHKVGLKSVANITTNNSCKYRSEFRPRPAETFAFISSHSSRSGRLAESSVRASLLLSGLRQCRVTAVKIRTSASAPPSRQNPTLLENKGSNLFGLLRGMTGRRFDPDLVHQSIERSRFKYPGLELRSPLFQNDSELPFVVETAQIWVERFRLANNRSLTGESLSEGSEAPVGIDIIHDDCRIWS